MDNYRSKNSRNDVRGPSTTIQKKTNSFWIIRRGFRWTRIIAAVVAFFVIRQFIRTKVSRFYSPLGFSIRNWMTENLAHIHAWINVITLLLFGFDKVISTINHRYRIRESTLLFGCLVGGSCGAIIAMELFQHKTSKSSFLNNLYSIIVLQVIVFVVISIAIR